MPRPAYEDSPSCPPIASRGTASPAGKQIQHAQLRQPWNFYCIDNHVQREQTADRGGTGIMDKEAGGSQPKIAPVIKNSNILPRALTRGFSGGNSATTPRELKAPAALDPKINGHRSLTRETGCATTICRIFLEFIDRNVKNVSAWFQGTGPAQPALGKEQK
jgi:hypothetical protein